VGEDYAMSPASTQNVPPLSERETDAEPLAPEAPPLTNRADLGERQAPSAGDEISAIDEGILSKKLSEAELMLAHAAEAGKELNPDVIAILTNALDAHAHRTWTKALTEQFWPAYGKLCAAIKPVTGDSLAACTSSGLVSILDRYRRWTLYLVLAILPLSILMFINAYISNEINDRINENNALVVTLHDELLNVQRTQTKNDKDVATELQQLATSNRSLLSLASLLNGFVARIEKTPFSDPEKRQQALQLPVPLTDMASAGFEKIRTYQEIRTYAKDVQQMNLMFYGAITAYFLPILWRLCLCPQIVVTADSC